MHILRLKTAFHWKVCLLHCLIYDRKRKKVCTRIFCLRLCMQEIQVPGKMCHIYFGGEMLLLIKRTILYLVKTKKNLRALFNHQMNCLHEAKTTRKYSFFLTQFWHDIHEVYSSVSENTYFKEDISLFSLFRFPL